MFRFYDVKGFMFNFIYFVVKGFCSIFYGRFDLFFFN